MRLTVLPFLLLCAAPAHAAVQQHHLAVVARKNADAAPALPADEIGTTAFNYGGVRLLRSAYSGPLLTVVRSSDSSSRDIDALNGVLDTADMLTWSGSDTVTVNVVHDQSGNDRDWTAASATQRPMIVNAGVLLTDGDGNPRMLLDGSDDLMTTGTVPSLPTHALCVFTIHTHTDEDVVISAGSNARSALRLDTTGGNNIKINSGASLDDTSAATVDGGQYVAALYTESGTSDSVRLNANTATPGSAGDNAPSGSLRIGDTTVCADVSIFEVWWFPAALGGDEATLRNNINAFYTLF